MQALEDANRRCPAGARAIRRNGRRGGARGVWPASSAWMALTSRNLGWYLQWAYWVNEPSRAGEPRSISMTPQEGEEPYAAGGETRTIVRIVGILEPAQT